MEEKIALLKSQVKEKIAEIKSTSDAENIRVEYLGKKGEVIEILKNLRADKCYLCAMSSPFMQTQETWLKMEVSQDGRNLCPD